MKTIKLIAFSAEVAFTALSAHAQGTFQNLNFEQAYPIFISGSQFNDATTASALPDWTVTIGGVQQSEIPVNDPSTGASWVSLVGPGTGNVFSPIDGNYSVLLQNYGLPAVASISQSGIIPSGTQTLLFEAQPPIAPSVNGSLTIQIGTQSVPYQEVGTGPGYTLYGANISAWAGQTEELTFSDPNLSGNWEIDDISFSPTSVTPEPSPLALMGIGGLLFALYRRFAGK